MHDLFTRKTKIKAKFIVIPHAVGLGKRNTKGKVNIIIEWI